MTEPAEFDENKTPFAVLDGKKWPIPVFVWRQLEVSRNKIKSLNDVIIGSSPKDAGERYMALDDDQYRTMGEVVYQALLGAHPGLSLDEFRNMRISDGQLFEAFLVARKQSGVYVFREASEGETGQCDGERDQPGEAEAGSLS